MSKYNFKKYFHDYKIFNGTVFQKIIIIVSFDLIMLIILNMTILQNYNTEIEVNNEKIKKLKVHKNNYALKLTEIKTIQHRLTMLNLDIPRLTNMFYMVDKLIANNKLKLIEMLPREVESIGPLSFQDIQINAQGSYFNLIKFMMELDQLRIYFSIQDYAMNESQLDAQQDKLIKLKLKIRLYYPNVS